MWESQLTKINPTTLHFQILRAGRSMSVAEVVKGWIEDRDFRAFYSQLLTSASFKAFFWELPPMVAQAVDQTFEFVLVNSNNLARVSPIGKAFKTHFSTDEPIVVFENLGKDATLVVPTPKGKPSAYPHLAQFVRSGPKDQIDEFWKRVGQTYQDHLSDRPLWLSTSGLGVYWLHVRLDTYPKYYTYQPYRQFDI